MRRLDWSYFCGEGTFVAQRRSMVASSVAINARQMGWLRGFSFDATYIFGILGIALVSGWFVITNPNLFPAVFVLNGWLLGYHHVVSTYTRLTFDRESFISTSF